MDGTNAYINLLLQVPLVGVFIWFAMRQTDSFLAALERRDEAWRSFLSEQRVATNKAIERLSCEINDVGKEVAELRGRMNE